MIYPAIVSFIAGIVTEQIFGLGWSVSVLVFLVSLVLFFYFKKDNYAVGKIVFIAGVAFLVGNLRMTFVNNFPDQNLLQLVGQNVSFEAIISDEPDVRDNSARYTIVPEFPLEHISSKSLVLLVADRFPEFRYGDKIKVSGELNLPKNFSNDIGSEFDYVSYLSKDKIHFLIYRPEIKKIGNEGNKIISFLYSIKNIFIEKISAVVPEPNSSLLAGVIFGAKQSLGSGLLDDFRKIGLIHIVVLSGYNITIIAVGIFYLTSFLGKRKLAFVLSAVFIVLFAIMVGLGATVLRACLMTLIAILARFLGRPAEALRWLFIAGFLMLLWNPLILFYDPSFQLSFMATLGLILFSPFILSFISNHKFRKFIPVKFGLREIISSTLAVQFFVLPLLIRMSGFVSIISFVANPLILPLVPWSMSLGALTGALGIFSKIISWPFGALSYFITQIIISVTEFFANIPLATFQIDTLPLSVIFVWYFAYFLIYRKLNNNFSFVQNYSQ